jgi:molecular chaperone GrpE
MVKKTKTDSKILELENNYKRALADYQNQERRHKDLEIQMVKNASGKIIEKLLTILDSLELAQSHLKDKGLQMVIDQINTLLQSEGLQQITTDGQDFDPYTMDCTEIVEGTKDKVVETVSKGYTLYEKVLRPAKVKVGNTIPVIASLVPEPKQSHATADPVIPGADPESINSLTN